MKVKMSSRLKDASWLVLVILMCLWVLPSQPLWMSIPVGLLGLGWCIVLVLSIIGRLPKEEG